MATTLQTRRFPRTAAALLLGLVAVLLLQPAAAVAQFGSGEQVAAYIERNAELLTWAADLVSATEGGPAREVLMKARDMHQRSVGLMRGERPGEAAMARA